MNSAACRFGGHPLGERRIDRTAINPKRVWRKKIQKSIGAESGLFDCFRMSQHREEHVYLFGEFYRGTGESSTRAKQRLCFGASTIEHDQTMSLLLQVRRHPASHDAQTNESNSHFPSFHHAAVINS